MPRYSATQVRDMEQLVRSYFRVVNDCLRTLVRMNEHEIAVLPSWLLERKAIDVHLFENSDEVVIEARPNHDLTQDRVAVSIHQTSARAREFVYRLNQHNVELLVPLRETYVSFGDMWHAYGDSQFTVPEQERVLFTGGGVDRLYEATTEEKAKEFALDSWDKRNLPGKDEVGSYVRQVQQILTKLKAIVSGEEFDERPVHRYIHGHRSLLLPAHKRCLFEHRIYTNTSYMDADIVLEMESGRPAMLVELESPKAKVLTKKNEWTAAVNHARNQISDWVEAIDDIPTNREGDLSFLAGPKERLVVIGRGMKHAPKLRSTVRSDTTIWTYDLLIDEALHRQNESFRTNCRLLGLEERSPFSL